MWPPKRTMKENGLEITDWDQPIYRIFPKKRFIDILQSNKNGLVRPIKWEDPMENFLLKSTVKTAEGELGSLENIAASWYGQCWTTNPESDAMWRIYSHDKNGIKVSTTINKLFSSIYDENDDFRNLKYFIGRVSYESRDAIEKFLSNVTFSGMALGGQGKKFAKTLCIKRPEFEHEKEIRLLFHDAENEFTSQDCVDFQFDHSQIIDEVVVEPRLTSTEYQAIKKELVGKGCLAPISQSQLYQVTPTTIPL